MPAKIRIEMPLPRPRSVICSPSHIRNIVPVDQLTTAVMRKPKPGSITRPGRAFQRDRDAERLEERQAQRAVARVLRDLAPAGFAFLLQRLERRHHVGHQLHDDRRRDVRHDAQREHREARQRAAREHVEQAQDAALLALEQLRELVRVDARHRDVRADAVDHEREQQEDKPAPQVAELAALAPADCALVATDRASVSSCVPIRPTLPPAASIAALAPAVAPMPVSLTALVELARLDDLDDLGDLADQAGLLQRQQVDFGQRRASARSVSVTSALYLQQRAT